MAAHSTQPDTAGSAPKNTATPAYENATTLPQHKRKNKLYVLKWKATVVELETIVNLDIHLQETKAHDNKLCEATERLSGMLARYKVSYNDAWDCLHQNLQVQKTSYMHDVLKAIVSRILELKHEIQKLEISEYHFGNNGMIDHKLTTDDTQLAEIPDINERPDSIQAIIKDVFKQVKEKKIQLEKQAEIKKSPEEEIDSWWDDENTNIKSKGKGFDMDEKKVELTEEQKQIKQMAELIQAQEKTRRVIAEITQHRIKREKWEKDLTGTLRPLAPYEIRERAAKLIQQACKTFFKLKREKILECKRNELFGITPYLKPKLEQKQKLEQVKTSRRQLKRQYEEKWHTEFECLKQSFLKRKSEEIREDYRDHIRDWFKTWYESIKLFHDIPGEKEGGAALIFREELPTPEEWLDNYNTYLAEKKANTGSAALDKKNAKLEAKREETERKRAEHMKQKLEEAMRKKMMKNPTLHPGFDYPISKKTDHILQVIGNYYKDWAELDEKETLDVKEKFVRDVDLSNVYMEAKLEIVSTVEDDMRKELKLLKNALKRDYESKDEKMPEPMKQKYKREKKKKNVKNTLSVNMAEKLEDLVFHGYMKEYPKTKIDEFIGDPNFAGDDFRCNYLKALPHNGDMRNLWWEKCRELTHGFHRILLVGSKGSGKTTLVHALATLNDAVLFELDPRIIHGVLESGAYLEHMMHSLASCAKAVQPSVIHIKHVQRLYYRKVPAADAHIDWKVIERFFVTKLFKQIHKTDKITVIGTCVDPWLTKSNKLLKQFPTVALMPNTSHGTVAQILKDWVLSYTVLPADFDVTCLAHVLKGYSFGYLKCMLQQFMNAETIVKIAARGLAPMDVYNFIIQNGIEEKVDYEKYVNWHTEKTAWGKKEERHQKEQLAFKQALAEHAQRMEKKKKSES